MTGGGDSAGQAGRYRRNRYSSRFGMKGEGVPQGALVNINGTGILHGKWIEGKGYSARRVGIYRRYKQSHGSGMGVLFCVAK